MTEYIEREKLPPKKKRGNYLEADFNVGWNACLDKVNSIPAADVVKPKTCKNVAIEYDDCDQFVCSECGIELQDWRRVERDEDDGDITYHEYRLRYCPNCGAKIGES